MPNPSHSRKSFFDSGKSVEELRNQAISTYGNAGFKSLHKRGNFRIGLAAIVNCILQKMTKEEFQQCRAEFNTPIVDDNLLYFAEIANQLTSDSWKEHFTHEECFDWHCKAALCYSTFFAKEVLCLPTYDHEIKNNLKEVILPMIQRNTEGMQAIDRVKAAAKLRELTPGSLFYSALSATPHFNLTQVVATPSSVPATTERPTERSVLSFFPAQMRAPTDLPACPQTNHRATSYRHFPYAPQGASPFIFNNHSSLSPSEPPGQQNRIA